ncbi:MAG: hypothetical protein WBV84_10705 [Nitrososphaeraceae archaeon]
MKILTHSLLFFGVLVMVIFIINIASWAAPSTAQIVSTRDHFEQSQKAQD